MTRIPDEFLSAIGRVESGRLSAGAISPWPWTVNAAGTGHVYATKQDAIAAVHTFLAGGIRSLDVGCLQVSLLYHPEAFGSLDQAFDPASNAAYAGKLLLDLFQTTGSWPRAAAAYHSFTPALGEAYQQKVLQAWATPDRAASPGAQHGGKHAPHVQPDLAASTPAQTAPAPTPVASATAQPVAGAASPAAGFNRTIMLAQGPRPLGRTLSAYRAAPVRLAWHPPAVVSIVAR